MNLENSNDSPLSEVIRDRRINVILESIRAAVRKHEPLSIEPKDVDYIRRSFTRGLKLGEQRLYEMSQKILHDLAPGLSVRVSLEVLGRCALLEHEGIITGEVDLTKKAHQLSEFSDARLSDQYPPKCERCGTYASVIASFVRFEPERSDHSTIVSLFTRIKTTSNICYKIADMVLDIDIMFRRDKIYNSFSQVVTDVYGLKLVVPLREDVFKTAHYFRTLPDCEVVEEKDYTGERKKRSGYEAFKIVLRCERQLFEVQIQSKEMFDLELNNRSANHKTYKERQMAERRKLGKEYVAVYQALNILLAEPDENLCSIEYVEIAPLTKGHDDEF